MMFAGIFFNCLLLGVVLYQLISGRLLDRSWKTFATRSERPRLYWSVLSIETAATLTMAYMILHDLVVTKR
jgi:amino acid permease